VLYEHLNQGSELFAMLKLAIGQGFDGPLPEQSDVVTTTKAYSMSMK